MKTLPTDTQLETYSPIDQKQQTPDRAAQQQKFCCVNIITRQTAARAASHRLQISHCTSPAAVKEKTEITGSGLSMSEQYVKALVCIKTADGAVEVMLYFMIIECHLTHVFVCKLCTSVSVPSPPKSSCIHSTCMVILNTLCFAYNK